MNAVLTMETIKVTPIVGLENIREKELAQFTIEQYFGQLGPGDAASASDLRLLLPKGAQVFFPGFQHQSVVTCGPTQRIVLDVAVVLRARFLDLAARRRAKDAREE